MCACGDKSVSANKFSNQKKNVTVELMTSINNKRENY